ncbi:MAG: prepilin peptidase [Pseudomonadota bacterium]
MHWGIPATVFVIGLLCGSFLNVVIHRGPALWGLVDDKTRAGGLAAPRSYCPACGKTLHAIDLAPIFSFLMLRGRCRFCDARISKRYPAVECLAGLASVLAVYTFGLSAQALFASLFLWALIALAVIDSETGFLPDALTLPLCAAGLAVNAFGGFAPIQDALIGAIIGFGAFWAISAVYRVLRGREGLGLGDAKLLAACGAWLGWAALAPIIFVGSLAALIGVAVHGIVDRRVDAQAPIAFGPALAAAAAIVMFAPANDLPAGYW